ncbi:exonuclease domain-containing protein [Aurantimonas sp. C2-6-R+9]|uniref:exonuclease domain-containing protein n=1 Tax=unclassified Aurantimonas TaxID=2638230 RepID=UPI003FA49392
MEAGLGRVSKRPLTRREYRLIRPRQTQFNPINISIHGITEDDVRDSPEFPDVFHEFISELEGALLLAHNSSFDISVLNASLRAYGLARPQFLSACTLALSRRIWPTEPSHRLSTLAHRFGVNFQHHHAGEDAFACANIALEGVRHTAANDVVDLARECPGLC